MTRSRRAVPLPRGWSLNTRDIVAVLIANGLLITAMWLRHGALNQLTTLSGWFIAAGELTALQGGYLALIQLVLMSRSPWLEQVVGQDALTSAHRWVGFACVWLIVAHVFLTTLGFALGDGSNLIVEAWTLLVTYQFMLMAGVSLVLFIAVAVSSVRIATALGLALLFSFKTPAETASAQGPGHGPVTPVASTDPGASSPASVVATPAPVAGQTAKPVSTPQPSKEASKGNGTFTGAVVQEPFGQVQVQITMSGGKLTDVTVLQMSTHGRSGFISQSAAPILHDEALAAQSANIDLVSGATYTSDAYAQSLQSALDQAHA